jgi:hypothetical protein
MVPKTRPTHGVAVHKARGLCRKCYDRAKNAGRLIDYERITYSTEELVQEWCELRRYGCTRAEAEQRLGLRPKSLQKALSRARKRGLVAA